MQSHKCRKCGRTYWDGERHICARPATPRDPREVPAEADSPEVVDGEVVEVRPPASPAPRVLAVIAVVVVLAVVLVVLWKIVLSGSQQTPSAQTSAPAVPDLAVVDGPTVQHPEDSLHVFVRGRVRNTRPKAMRRIWVTVEFYSKDNALIKKAGDYVESDPLEAGDTSFWEVITLWEPEMAEGRVRVGFTRPLGGPTQWIN